MLCCPLMDDLVENAGRRGLAVLVLRANGGFAFALQGRGVSHEEERRIPAGLGAPGLEFLRIRESVRIRHCPGCGTGLADLVESCGGTLESLAAAHENLLA